ncbi:unnamed protein product [Effrenium voratum]|nr:unnamed protein product [Effrenium voratum]
MREDLQGWHLLSQLPRRRLRLSDVSRRTAAGAALCAGRWEAAGQLAEPMDTPMAAATVPWQRAICLALLPPPSVAAFSAAISGLGAASRWQHALLLLGEAIERLPAADVDAALFSAGITACEQAGRWEIAVALLMELHGLRLADAIACNAALAACAGAANASSAWRAALGLLGGITALQLQANVITYSSACSACEKAGEWQRAVALLWELVDMMQANVVVFNAAISACEKRGMWQMALQILNALPSLQAQPDTITFNATISSCEKGRQWPGATLLLATCPSPDVVAYNAALSACRGHWQHARRVLQELSRRQAQPDAVTHSLAAEIFERSGEARRAAGRLDVVSALCQVELAESAESAGWRESRPPCRAMPGLSLLKAKRAGAKLFLRTA